MNASEIIFDQSPLALQMFLHGKKHWPETWLKNRLFSRASLRAHGTAAGQPPYSNNSPHWKHTVDERSS